MEKLLLKRATHGPGPAPSPAASPSLSDRRRARPPRGDPPSSASSDRSQEEDSLPGSRSDRLSLSSSSCPLSRRSRIPRPVAPADPPAPRGLQPRPPPGRPPGPLYRGGEAPAVPYLRGRRRQ
ncbi:unnamed protein product [Gadus morhua 'NCC']